MKKILLILLGLTASTSILIAQHVRTPESFNKLNIASAFTVELQQSETNKIEISGVDAENIENIATEVKNNTLYIYAKKKVVAKSSMKIVVSFVVLDELTVSGASSVKNNEKLQFNNFNLDVSGAANLELNADYTTLTAEISGASNVKLNGNTPVFNLKSSGASEVKAENLISKDAEIEISGASTVVVYASNSINGEVSGASSVKILGNPTKSDIHRSGVSSVNGVEASPFLNEGFSKTTSTEIDTTTFKWKGHKVLIINNDSLYEKKIKLRKLHWAGLDLGINGFAQSFSKFDLSNTQEESANPKEITEFMEVKLNKSWAFSINFYEKYIPIFKHNVGLVTGLGIEWNNYELRNNVRLISNGGAFVNDTTGFNNDYTWGVVDSVRDYSKNRFKTVLINAPILLEINTGKNPDKSLHLAFGAIVGWNIHTKMKYKFKENGETIKEKLVQDFNTNPFRLSLTARLGIGYFNVFATYSLTQLFENNKGPEIYPFSVGVTLLSFSNVSVAF